MGGMKRHCHSKRMGVETEVEDYHSALKLTKTDDQTQKVEGPLTTASSPASPRQTPGEPPLFPASAPDGCEKLMGNVGSDAYKICPSDLLIILKRKRCVYRAVRYLNTSPPSFSDCGVCCVSYVRTCNTSGCCVQCSKNMNNYLSLL